MDKSRNDKSSKDNSVMPVVFGVHQLNRIPLFVLINQSLITIYYNNSHK